MGEGRLLILYVLKLEPLCILIKEAGTQRKQLQYKDERKD